MSAVREVAAPLLYLLGIGGLEQDLLQGIIVDPFVRMSRQPGPDSTVTRTAMGVVMVPVRVPYPRIDGDGHDKGDREPDQDG